MNGPGEPKKRLKPDDLAVLPDGQRRAVQAFIGAGYRSYPAAAKAAGISLGTFKTHLRRVRLQYPDVWALVAARRAQQRQQYHEQAQKRAAAHTRRYFRNLRRSAARIGVPLELLMKLK